MYAQLRLFTLLLATCFLSQAVIGETLEVWHTYGVGSAEERAFESAVTAFSEAHPNFNVEVVRIPFQQNLQQFINAAQAAEAPDLIRLSETELGKIGHISVEGLPLLEDLRPHLTPVEKQQFNRNALKAMTYRTALYGLPASQSCMTLFYNKALFEDAGESPPASDWTLDDLIATAKRLSSDDVAGLALPIKWSYWLIPFISAKGGQLFEGHDVPSLDAAGNAEALTWVLDLERQHQVTGAINSIEVMNTRFQTGRAAMVIDGPWNWDRYVNSSIPVGTSVLPFDETTGLRVAPIVGYFGWSVTKQSAMKPAAVQLALWLSSYDVQKDFSLATYSLPTLNTLLSDPALLEHEVLGGFIHQVAHGLTLPTSRASSMLFEQLDTALALTYDGSLSAAEALEAADAELERMLAR